MRVDKTELIGSWDPEIKVFEKYHIVLKCKSITFIGIIIYTK